MVPSGYDPRARYPLVIQTYGFDPARFYRDGANVYDGYTSGFAGRAFLRENMLVLAVPWGPASGEPGDEHEALKAFPDGVKGAIDALVAEGVVDRDRVGIMGWSATGQRVLEVVTFSDAPIRAATMMDGDANTLFSVTITYAVKDSIQLRKEEANQGGPYGASWANWIKNDPSLHTDCIRAALRMETYGPEVHNNWDIYALLRRQYKPVEFIFFPHGAHALARPKDRMISLQGNVDWYRFWLKDEKRSEVLIPGESAASLSEQYRRWGQMAELKRADDAKPACVRATRGG
jgi:dipeptidyl aminopeptidase/acylaminoacyl peptidase